MWTAIAFWFCVVWFGICILLTLRNVAKGDLVGFFVTGGEAAFLFITALVLNGALA